MSGEWASDVRSADGGVRLSKAFIRAAGSGESKEVRPSRTGSHLFGDEAKVILGRRGSDRPTHMK